MNVQSLGGAQGVSQLLLPARTSAAAAPPPPQRPSFPAESTLTNADGQSLLDIRDKLEAAVKAALDK